MNTFIFRNKTNFVKLFSLFVVIQFMIGCQMSPDPAINISLNSLFTDNMVLQQKQDIPIWGTAEPGGEVIVELSDQHKNVIVDTSGKWSIKLAPVTAGGPYELVVKGEETRTIKNVMVGEVWICSGQSNMEMAVDVVGSKIDNSKEEVANAKYPNIRLLIVDKVMADTPKESFNSEGWKECSPETVPGFSAVAYLFGRRLHTELNVPIGLIETAWGGTVVETWTSAKSLKDINEYVEAIDGLTKTAEVEKDISKSYDKVQRGWIDGVNKQLSDAGILERKFKTYGYDTKKWNTLEVPKLWEKQNIIYDGVMWVKRSITIPEGWQGEDLTLNLGMINDYDITWFNGELVGSRPSVGMFRNYTIPKNIVKAGENEITVLILDIGNNGGIYGDPENISIENSVGENISLVGKWNYKKDKFDQTIITHPPGWPVAQNRPTVLYNGMINPLLPYGIRGAIWYQGEGNGDRGIQYRKLFKALINGWREVWGQGDFPFLFVQLANFMPSKSEPTDEPWAYLREAQTMALDLPNTGMAVTIDIGDADDIHPTNKQDVGKRLALNALANVYGKEIPYSGPMYKSMEVDGSKIKLQFDHTNNGLKIKGSKLLKGFAIAGADKKFVWARAKIEGNEVVVWNTKVKNPVAVRYAWANNPICNLYNGAELPASPFRTDDW